MKLNQMRLNLGCGKVILPFETDPPPFGTHLRPFFPSQFKPGWINVDKYAMPGVQEQIDLFRFPWIRSSNGSPFNDDSAEEILASHIVEHVPHKVEMAAGLPPQMAKQYTQWCNNLDGFFVFFAECWRILKPDGLIHVHVPWANSTPAVCDPTHTRMILPGTFGYLAPSVEAPFDYKLPMHYEIHGDAQLRFTGKAQLNPEWTAQQVTVYALETWDVCDELRLTLRAVKE